jgi:hypothetical protein
VLTGDNVVTDVAFDESRKRVRATPRFDMVLISGADFTHPRVKRIYEFLGIVDWQLGKAPVQPFAKRFLLRHRPQLEAVQCTSAFSSMV